MWFHTWTIYIYVVFFHIFSFSVSCTHSLVRHIYFGNFISIDKQLWMKLYFNNWIRKRKLSTCPQNIWNLLSLINILSKNELKKKRKKKSGTLSRFFFCCCCCCCSIFVSFCISVFFSIECLSIFLFPIFASFSILFANYIKLYTPVTCF